MLGNRDQYFVRRQLGNPVGPFTEVVLTAMLKKGTLDGSEEISVDRRTWRPVRELGQAAPAAEIGFAPDGTEVLPAAGLARPAFAPMVAGGGDDVSGSFHSDPGGSPGLGTAHASLDLGAADALPLELDAADLMPVELHPLEIDTPKAAR